MRHLPDRHLCNGCHACFHACPAQAISMERDEEGFLYPHIHETLCIQCGICDRTCPIYMPPTLNPLDNAFATYAADSTGVPTLVVGYSVKARGIARDLFGTEEGYVLPVQELSSPEQLTKAFCTLYEKREYIRNLLALTLPNYRQNVQQAVNTIKDLRKT